MKHVSPASLDLAAFRRAALAGGAAKVPGLVRLAPAAELQILGDTRVMSFVFSDGNVDRYGDTIDARGWVLDSFNANPVALFGHDANTVENVIGRARNVRIEGNRLVGEIEFMEATVNPNAEAVFQMLKAGFLNAVSVGFQPLDWQLSKDKSRPQGIDFKKQELLEISVVPIPANPTALVQARAAGIEVDRLALSEAVPRKIKSLWHVGWLAMLLGDLGYLADDVEWEAGAEADGSTVPAQLAQAMATLGQALIDMTAEEVAELLAGDDEGAPGDDDDLMMLQGAPKLRLLKHLAAADPAIVAVVLDALTPKSAPFDLVALRARLATTKAGRVLSAANEKKLRDAHATISGACESIMSICDAVTPEDPEPDADDAEAKAARARRERVARVHASRATAL